MFHFHASFTTFSADRMFAATFRASYDTRLVARIFLMILERPGLISLSRSGVDGAIFSASISCAV
jgi:hypothetical protein